MKALYHIALVLVTVGALNWGLVGAASYNLVEALFGAWPLVVAIIYDLVGLAGLYMVYEIIRCCTGKGSCCDGEGDKCCKDGTC